MSTISTSPTLRVRVGGALAALTLLVSALAAPATADPGSSPGVCEIIQPPAGSKVVFHTYAEGVQIYRWNGSRWLFDGPSAVLYADAGGAGKVGIHYGGPTWHAVSGSKVKGMLLQPCPVDPNSIPWLLLQAVQPEGPGIFEGVTHIQRVNTVGGVMPSFPGTVVDQVERVPYTAEYFFYRAP